MENDEQKLRRELSEVQEKMRLIELQDCPLIGHREYEELESQYWHKSNELRNYLNASSGGHRS